MENGIFIRIYQRIKPMVMVCLLMCSVGACDQMTDNYQKYLEGGEIVYPGKADSIQVHPGNYRVELQWLVMSDLSVNSAVVYWNYRQNSRKVNISRTTGIDTVKVVLNDMEEQTYTFEIYTFDREDNQSVKAEAIGVVYGDKYRSSLLDRAIRSFDYNEEEDCLAINWENADEGTVGVEIMYTDLNGQDRTLSAPVKQENVLLENFNAEFGFKFSTVFMPDSMAIDTFMTAFKQIELNKVEKEVDKSLFSLAVFPGDYSVQNAAANNVSQVWTNPTGCSSNCYLSLVGGHDLPQWFTMDMGKAYELTRFKYFMRGDAGTNSNMLYASGNLTEFEVWGALDPDFSYNPDDHGGDFGPDWVLLSHCVVNRPSGNYIPPGTATTRSDNTEEDIAVAVSGHEYSFDYTGKVRYFRIKGIGTWDPRQRQFIQVSSIQLWGMQY